MKPWVPLACAAFLLAAYARAEDKKPLYQVGDTVEDCSLTDLDRKAVKLSSFNGKVVLINFWASW